MLFLNFIRLCNHKMAVSTWRLRGWRLDRRIWGMSRRSSVFSSVYVLGHVRCYHLVAQMLVLHQLLFVFIMYTFPSVSFWIIGTWMNYKTKKRFALSVQKYTVSLCCRSSYTITLNIGAVSSDYISGVSVISVQGCLIWKKIVVGLSTSYPILVFVTILPLLHVTAYAESARSEITWELLLFSKVLQHFFFLSACSVLSDWDVCSPPFCQYAL